MSKKENNEDFQTEEQQDEAAVSAEAQARNKEADSENDENTPDTDTLLSEIEQLKQELAQKDEHLLRKAAEFENLRKRTQRERVQLFEDAKINAVRDFLPVYDDLERTINNIPDSADDSFTKGVQLVYNKFSTAMKQMGVETIHETGVPFDVDLHDALLRQPAPDDKTPDDTVLQVLETGYKMGEKVIRHAKVIVSE